ncbi:hypothetical protein IWX90DRAFT_86741 [Phyllosticta citrichinensis]|uniref:C2H2-type domain-containing protein n=1 Tax=Phyllosticta citrichinensis TaxID=1130410 RepID=A0ABR1XFP6_9PEZI
MHVQSTTPALEISRATAMSQHLTPERPREQPARFHINDSDHGSNFQGESESASALDNSNMSTSDSASTRRHRCTICGMQFGRTEHVKRHTRTKHTLEKPFACTMCGRRFSRRDNMAQHQETQHTFSLNSVRVKAKDKNKVEAYVKMEDEDEIEAASRNLRESSTDSNSSGVLGCCRAAAAACGTSNRISEEERIHDLRHWFPVQSNPHHHHHHDQ